MAYLNLNNMCTFEGRLTADPELSYIPGSGLAKCKIKIAVDKQMTKEQKQAAQSKNEPTADFIPVDMIGKRAETIANHFSKGDGIKVVCSYRTFQYQGQDGQTKYGSGFDAVDFTFPVGGRSNNNQNGGNQRYQGNQGGNPGFEPMGLDPQGFQAIDDDDIPF